MYYDYIEAIEAIYASFHARLDLAKILFPNRATLVKIMPPGMATSHAWFLWQVPNNREILSNLDLW